MAKIKCENEQSCAWPDCECDYGPEAAPIKPEAWQALKPMNFGGIVPNAPETAKVLLPGEVMREPYKGKDAVYKGEPMYEGSKHQTPDAAKFKAVLNEQFGKLSEGCKVDAATLQRMLHEFGTDKTSDGRGFIVRKKDLEKLAEALNNHAS